MVSRPQVWQPLPLTLALLSDLAGQFFLVVKGNSSVSLPCGLACLHFLRDEVLENPPVYFIHVL